jgi:FKBP-type peptidyl-prolyl cis-trans isomerase 2
VIDICKLARSRPWIFVMFCAIAFWWCTSNSALAQGEGDYSPPAAPTYRQAIEIFTPSGLGMTDVRGGSGEEARPGDTVAIRYSTFLTNDPNLSEAQFGWRELEFVLGREQVIKGLDEGVVGMHVGGARVLSIPVHLAIGGPSGAVPVDQPLTAIVYLLRLGPTGDGHPANAITIDTAQGPGSSTSVVTTSGTSVATMFILFLAGAALFLVALIQSAKGRQMKRPVVFDAKSIAFDRTWEKELLGRLKRDWSDLHAVDFDGDVSSKNLRNWRVAGCSLRLDFKSGGEAVLDLEQMSREEVEEVLLAIERSAEQSVLSKRALLFERQIMAVDNDVPISYTSIWTDALEAQFGATNFVPLRTGSLLKAGHYEIRMQLASGGLSAIYLAKSESSKKIVLKESVLPLDTDERTRVKAKELFEREAKILEKLNHPQVAKVLDYFAEDGRDYIVLEYIPGMSIRQMVQAEPERARANAVSWAKQIAGIMRYLHELEPPIVHRDLTPDNLLVKEDGTIALIDFGASNEFVSKATGTLVGKQAYIPAEQFRGKAEPKSDVYAFGATLHYILTGKDPIPLTQSHPRAVSHAVPENLDEFCALCTRSDPGARPSAAELVQICENGCHCGASVNS